MLKDRSFIVKKQKPVEEPKPVKKKHTLAIVLSIVGGVLLLGIIGIAAFILSIKHEVEEENRYNSEWVIPDEEYKTLKTNIDILCGK